MFGTTPGKMFGVFACLALASQATGHLFIQYPAAPLEGPIKDPLEADGSNFPCHGANIPSSGGMKMTAGGSQLLQFDDGGGANTATHGGGSCQLSLYYGDNTDAMKKDPKNWHVILSIEGGCPTNAEGNLPTSIQCTDPGADGTNCLNSYNFTIPRGVKAGHATFAWTWFNTIGNREMYMNCVNAQIEGGDSSEMNEFPSLFVANLAGGSMPQCSTSESQAYKFPFPGKYVTSDTKGSPYKLSMVSGGSCAADGTPAGGASAGGAAPGGGAAPSYGSAPPAPSGNAGGSGKPPGQVTVTTMETMTSGSTAPTSAPAAPPASSAAPSAAPVPSSAAAPAPYPSSSGSSSGSGSCPAGAQPCSNDGEVVCMGTQFGLCNNGCAVAQPLAAGTTCTDGKIAKRDHVRRHIGRAHVRQFA